MPSSDGMCLRLVRVLAAPPQEDDEIRLQTLELYEDGLVIRWSILKEIPIPESTDEWDGWVEMLPLRLMSLTLRDSVGTAYEPYGATGGSSQGYSMFGPEIPEQASWLDAITKNGTVRFDLSQ